MTVSDCECQIEATNVAQRKVLTALLLINAGMFVGEVVVGIVAQSTGVLADSLDMLADALVYGLSLYAATRPDARNHAARWSGYFQIAIAVGVLVDIVRRAVFGSEPVSLLMFGISVVALAANVACLRLIARHRDGGVHMRASWIFSRNDVIANLGVILASILVYLTHSRWPDLGIGLLITGIVLRGGFAILQDAREDAANRKSVSPRTTSEREVVERR